MFGHRYFGRRYFGTRYFGPPGLISIALTGFANDNAFGSPEFDPGAETITLSGFADSDSFGSPELVPGAVAIGLAGFADADTFGSAAFVPGAIGISLTGFADVNEFGGLAFHPSITLTFTGFADADGFGNPTLTVAATPIALSGFADADGFGHPRFIPGPVTITLTGFVDADRIGNPVLQAVTKKGQGGGGKPGGVAAGQKYGTRVLIDQAGLIIALEADSGVTKTVNTRMGLYSDAAALPDTLLGHSAVKTSVVAGANRYDLQTPVAVHIGTEVWPTLHSDGNFSWFLSAGAGSRFNADAFADGLASPFGPSTPEANKAPVFAILLEAVTITLGLSGIVPSNAFGTMRMALNIAASGIASTSAVGSPTLAPGAVTLSATGFANESTIGVPVLDLEAVTIRPDGFAAAATFGTLELAPSAVGLTLSGIANDNAFGSPVFALTAQTIDLAGFANDNGVGSPTLTAAAPLTINPMWLLGFRERPIRALEYPHTAPHRILDGEPVRELDHDGNGPIRELPENRIKEVV